VEISTQLIDNNRLSKAYSYQGYRELLKELKENQGTTGFNQSEDLVYYTSLNHQRMKRLDKTLKMNERIATEIQKIDSPQTWVVLTESWCGDAAYNIPVIQKIAELNKHITLRLLLRDSNPDIMDNYITNGGRSIPKLIMYNDVLEELATWGPRPVALQKIYDLWKNDPNKIPYKEFNVTLQKWYLNDKGLSVQNELSKLLENVKEGSLIL